jgi:hypothetical protein
MKGQILFTTGQAVFMTRRAVSNPRRSMEQQLILVWDDEESDWPVSHIITQVEKGNVEDDFDILDETGEVVVAGGG